MLIYLICSGTVPHRLPHSNCIGTVCSGTGPTQYWVSNRYGLRDLFTDVDRWSGTVPLQKH